MNQYDSERSQQRVRSSLGSVAKLVRIPNLFTAPPDVVLGVVIAASLGHTISITSFIGIGCASMLLYGAGTTLNDYVDTVEDARERPERPIPSGEISRVQALVFGVALLCGGVSIALLTGGILTGTVAAALAVLIVLYNGVFKDTSVGFLIMGGCRGTNVLLGLSLAVGPTALPGWALVIVGVISLYITCVTYMAESETGRAESRAVLVAVVAAVTAASSVVGLVLVRFPGAINPVTVVSLVCFLLWVGRPLHAAYSAPTPKMIGPAVGACIQGLILLEVAFAGTMSVLWAVIAASFFIPAVGLSTAFEMS